MPPTPTFTIIIPTAGLRPSLAGTLASLVGQIIPGDEIIVACNRDENWGDVSIDRCQSKASGSHILYCDDDDVFVPGALARIRSWAAVHPGVVGIFRRGFNYGGKQWVDPVIRPGNIQRMCLCVPNVPGRMPTWTGCETESAIPVEAARLQQTTYEFVDDVIGLGRPEKNPLRRLRYRVRLRTRIRGFVTAARSSAAGRL